MSVRSLTSLRAEARRLGVVVSSPATLAKYGMDERDWLAMLDDQDWRCPIKDHAMSRYVIDHEHVAGWKRMEPEQRRAYVRGLLCPGCNYFVLSRHISTAALARRVMEYLEQYEERRP